MQRPRARSANRGHSHVGGCVAADKNRAKAFGTQQHQPTNQKKKEKKNARSLVRHTLYMRFCPIHIRSRSIAVVLPRATAVCATANGESSLIANNFSPLSTQHVFDVCSFVVICQNKYEIYSFTRCDLLTVFSTNSQSQIMSRDRSLDFPCHLWLVKRAIMQKKQFDIDDRWKCILPTNFVHIYFGLNHAWPHLYWENPKLISILPSRRKTCAKKSSQCPYSTPLVGATFNE